ncbi:MAG: glutamate-5-semialdehyde dehydrogenase [Deltaproteobacteria bacterium]|nr:glutamate-5-semialdehyde dehydrogenase [Deltaproteobacteria bacterium]
MISDIAKSCREASIITATLSSEMKNLALRTIAKALGTKGEAILRANMEDLKKAREEGLRDVLYKRLKFDEEKLASSIEGVTSLIQLPDPVGILQMETELDDGLILRRFSCPIGVLGIVFESRPDALVQISCLALKSGNTVLLKGGAEALNTNRVLFEIINDAAISEGLPKGWMSLLETRDEVTEMLSLHHVIDLIIPRGSNEFVQYIMRNTKIPVLGHADGICHVYVDSKADMDMAAQIVYDSKCQYPAVCNAVETLLLHTDIAEKFLLLIKSRFDDAHVEIRGDETVQSYINCKSAQQSDWQTEYNDLIISIKIVRSVDEAIAHINLYGSHHTDAIVTEDQNTADRFTGLVDSANVFLNCSTRFSDGFRYGLGAEVGISTNKIHARGPVGLEGLTIYKWRLDGKGHVVADYAGPGSRKFKHRKVINA